MLDIINNNIIYSTLSTFGKGGAKKQSGVFSTFSTFRKGGAKKQSGFFSTFSTFRKALKLSKSQIHFS
jgi:hypothetical protein